MFQMTPSCESVVHLVHWMSSFLSYLVCVCVLGFVLFLHSGHLAFCISPVLSQPENSWPTTRRFDDRPSLERARHELKKIGFNVYSFCFLDCQYRRDPSQTVSKHFVLFRCFVLFRFVSFFSVPFYSCFVLLCSVLFLFRFVLFCSSVLFCLFVCLFACLLACLLVYWCAVWFKTKIVFLVGVFICLLFLCLLATSSTYSPSRGLVLFALITTFLQNCRLLSVRPGCAKKNWLYFAKWKNNNISAYLLHDSLLCLHMLSTTNLLWIAFVWFVELQIGNQSAILDF